MIQKFLFITVAALVALLPVSPAFASHSTTKAAAASAAKLKLVSSSSYTDSDSDFHVVGEVENVWNQTCGNCDVGVELLNSSGKKVTPSESFDKNPVVQPIDNGNLDPGEKSSFEVDGSDYPGAVAYKIVSFTASSAYQPSNQNFTVTGATASSEFGNEITGTITNNNKNAQKDPSVIGQWRDSTGTLVDAEIGLLSDCGSKDTIPAGGSCGFTIDQPDGAPTGVSTVPATYIFTSYYSLPDPMVATLRAASSKTVAYGSKLAVSATVYKGKSVGTAPSGIAVSLQELHGKTWKSLKTAKTNGSGVAGFGKRVFTSDATLRFQTPGKSPAYTGSSSTAFKITVVRGISAKFSKQTEHSSIKVTVKGLLGPKGGKTAVYLEEKSGGWKKIAEAKTNGKGAYTLSHSFTKAGKFPLRMYVPAGHGAKAATSQTEVLTVSYF